MNSILRTAGAALVVFAAVSLLTHNSTGVPVGTTTTAPARHYYLTKTGVTGNGALTACATGYHFASFAELSDLSDITYNKTLGQNAPDSGSGPPVFINSSGSSVGAGWIRTGAPSIATAPANAGDVANCGLWTSANSGDYGEVAFLSLFENTVGTARAPVLNFITPTCNISVRVWCVQN